MDNLTLREILDATGGEVIKKGKEVTYSAVSIDTRTIGLNSIFIALKGANFNGNTFSSEASFKGARICIIDEMCTQVQSFHEDTYVIKVSNGQKALLNLAKYYRTKLKIKVIGITGSTGKTSTKDLVAAALSSKYKVFKTKGNFNNEIGLPLMIFNITDDYDIAVLEMGMSNFGEIHNLTDVARPDIAIITNIGVSHLEFLKTRENILKAKLEITDFFNQYNTLIINNDNDLLNKIYTDTYKVMRVGFEERDNDFFALKYMLYDDAVNFTLHEKYENKDFEFNINIIGKHNISNSLLAIACGVKLGLSYEELQEGFRNIEFTSMRLDIIKGDKFTLIDDSYNASPDSMKAAIDVLASIGGKRKVAVLGTMKELGKEAFNLHKEVGEYAKFKNIDLLLCVGEFEGAYRAGYKINGKIITFSSNEDISDYLERNILQGDCILIKASRSMKFETIVNKLKSINC
jgi:UDP-N-acetylmuramoyl-tripeptide--D-alanyl-D-alanine ligase